MYRGVMGSSQDTSQALQLPRARPACGLVTLLHSRKHPPPPRAPRPSPSPKSPTQCPESHRVTPGPPAGRHCEEHRRGVRMAVDLSDPRFLNGENDQDIPGVTSLAWCAGTFLF